MSKTTQKQRKRALNNKRKGSNAERHYCNVFKDLHTDFSKCRTSRQGSRLMDDCKVDLINIPLLLQVKAGLQRGLNVSSVLQEMDEKLAENLPDDDKRLSLPKAVVHYKQVGRGKKRDKYSEIVSMTFEDFIEIFLKAYTK